MTDLSCYFKSTDGHVNTWDFSSKRLNFCLLERIQYSGGCWIIDASKRKVLPDSMSRTIPIWCAVMNRLYQHYYSLKQYPNQTATTTTEEGTLSSLYDQLYTPNFVVSQEEHETIVSLLAQRVEKAIQDGVIVNPERFIQIFSKPLRPFWICNNNQPIILPNQQEQLQYTCVICISCSNPLDPHNHIHNFDYIPGAADDEESWSCGLNHKLFWNHILQTHCKIPDIKERIKSLPEPQTLANFNQDKCDKNTSEILHHENHQGLALLTRLYPSYFFRHNKKKDVDFQNYFSTIPATGLSIGTRRSGRPPECWQYFDAIVNVTSMEYSAIIETETKEQKQPYLQMPVLEGKKDRTELEKYLALGIFFIIIHTVKKNINNRVLVHCAQGMDRSVAVVMATIALFYDCKHVCQNHHNEASMAFYPWCNSSTISIQSFQTFLQEKKNIHPPPDDTNEDYKSSGIPQWIADQLMGRIGRDLLLEWVETIQKDLSLFDESESINKQTFKKILIVIQQYREKADPSRKTMQKLNRFFMSGTFEK